MASDKTSTEQTQDKKKEKEKEKEKAVVNGVKKEEEEEELSEEDQNLKNELETLVERLKDSDSSLYPAELESLKALIRTSTSSMTAVPKPLKFLRPHYPDLQKRYEEWPASPVKESFADVLSVLAMTYSDDETLDSLKYRLLSPNPALTDWGHEYVRHLASELGIAHNNRTEAYPPEPTDDLLDLAKQIIPFLLSHNAEPDAVDLLSELDSISLLPDYVDENTWERVVAYVVACVPLLTQDEDRDFLICARTIYRKYGRLVEAMTLSIRLDDLDMIQEDFYTSDDTALKYQLALLLGRNQIWFQAAADESPEMDSCSRNVWLSEHFMRLAEELGVKDPKSPEDIYKSHLENTRPGLAGGVDSARMNLANTFVSAFVNTGMKEDKLGMIGKTVEKDGETVTTEVGQWIWKNKDMGMLSATASLGLLYLWDPVDSINQIDQFIYAEDLNIQAGALLAAGIMSSQVHDENDPALAVLSEFINSEKPSHRITSIMGLGIAYSGSNRDDLKDLFLPIITDTSLETVIPATAAFALGQIFLGQGAKPDNDIASAMAQTLLEMPPEQLSSPWMRFYILGLALLFFGKQDASDAFVETLKTIEHPIAQEAIVMLTMCSFAGTGEVLRIQQMLRLCAEKKEEGKEEGKEEKKEEEGESPENGEEEKKDEGKGQFSQSLAVLAIAAIAMGEDVGKELSLRHFGHLEMHFGEPMIRKAVPLAIGLLYASNPQLTVFETLSRYSHDSDLDVAVNAIFAMGLVGAGTNNARLAQLLRGLASYYHREPNCLFMVRIAQGLLHMGKGTMSLNPYHTDRQMLSRVSMAGLLPVLVSMLDVHHFILGNYHWQLYYLTPAIRPRFLITLDEQLAPLPVTVRVGQAVDTVGQAGRPKTITGFQTHTTPVLIGYGERAELATEEYLPLASVLEGFVILKKNPEYMEEDK